MTYPLTPLQVRIRIAPFVVDRSADPSTYPWIDITTYYDATFEITDSSGQTDDASESSTEFACTLRNTDARFTPDNPESPYWPGFVTGCPIEFAMDNGDGGGMRVQSVTYLGSVTIRWTAGTDKRCLAEIAGGGLFRALGLPAPIRSALRRTIPSSARRKAYWPMEDESGSNQAASAVPAVAPLTPLAGTPPEFGTESGVAGASSIATFRLGDRISAALPSPTTSNAVRVSHTLYAPTPPGGQVALYNLFASGGTIGRYTLELGTNNMRFRAYDLSGTEVSGAGLIGFTAQFSQTIYCELDLAQSGANITWSIRSTAWTVSQSTGLPNGASGVSSGSFAGTLGQVGIITLGPNLDLPDIRMGHVAITEPPLPASGGFAAVVGWAGNTACASVAGLATEFRLPSSVTSTTLGAVMGPQLIDSLLANLRDAQETDHGVLSDRLGVISYRAISELYNLAPSITLNRSVRGQIGTIEPVFDDQLKANIASATRRGGSTATVQDELDIARTGPYEREPITVNVALDSALPGHAGWSLARGRGSETGPRIPELILNMRVACENTPALGAQVLALLLGDRIAIGSGPTQMAKGSIELQVRGRKQVISGRYGWTVTYQVVPVAPYNAFILNTDRLDTAGTEVILAAAPADTLLMTATAGPAATVGAGLSIPLNAGGEMVTLTGVTNEPVVDAFTRSVSGGWGSIPATAHLPAYLWQVFGTGGTGAAQFNVTGTTGTISVTNAGEFGRVVTTAIQLAHPAFYAEVSYPAAATGGQLELELCYRRSSSTSYAFRVTIQTSGEVRAQLYTPASVLLADLPTAIVHSPGQVYKLLVSPIGSRHRCKVWTGSTEPDNWTVDASDTERLTAGGVQVRAGRGAGNTNSPAVSTWDNVTIRNVQAFTVVRGGAGFTKTLPVSSPVRLWKSRGMGI